MDVEFADGTGLNLDGQLTNMQQTYTTLTVFRQASDASTNCNKLVGFWVASNSAPQWFPHLGFGWILEGRLVKYLGCQVGLHISAEI